MIPLRDLLPILTLNDGSAVTPENWPVRRKEMLDALSVYSYGYTPALPVHVQGDIEAEDAHEFGNKIVYQKVRLSIENEKGVFAFPVYLYIPRHVEKPPVFLHPAFRVGIPSGTPPLRYTPAEEITDAGYALALIDFEDMVNDRGHGDFTDGLATFFGTSVNRASDEWGKIGMWAYGLSRVLDYLLTRDDLDAMHTAVIGQSRMGKAALWAGAQDERFYCTIANNSGYGGAATSKGGHGERVRDFLDAGSWDWYCENFKLFTDEKEDKKPYDQAWLLALIAPRLLCVGSGVEDRGADPESEFLTTNWASQAWDMLGTKGLITPDRMPVPGDVLHEGYVGYHLRPGGHFLTRQDWQYYIDFLNKKLGQ